VKTSPPSPRGYFAIGVEGISKPVNLGNLLRSAHAFGASFVFTIGASLPMCKGGPRKRVRRG
jgi:tRNA G18 (ribose-2'-O)-methylase SpoU